MKCEYCEKNTIVLHRTQEGKFVCTTCYKPPPDRDSRHATVNLKNSKKSVSLAHIKDIKSRRVASDGHSVERYKPRTYFT